MSVRASHHVSPPRRLLALRHPQEALSALRVPLNKRRLAVVDAAFSSIAAASAAAAPAEEEEEEEENGGANAVPLVQAVGRMNAEGHPEVAAGRLGPQEVRLGFRLPFLVPCFL